MHQRCFIPALLFGRSCLCVRVPELVPALQCDSRHSIDSLEGQHLNALWHKTLQGLASVVLQVRSGTTCRRYIPSDFRCVITVFRGRLCSAPLQGSTAAVTLCCPTSSHARTRSLSESTETAISCRCLMTRRLPSADAMDGHSIWRSNCFLTYSTGIVHCACR